MYLKLLFVVIASCSLKRSLGFISNIRTLSFTSSRKYSQQQTTHTEFDKTIFGYLVEDAESHLRKPPLTDNAKEEVVRFAKELDTEEFMPIILTGALGGYGLSEYASNLYKELYEKMYGAPFDGSGVDWEDSQFRTDPLMAAIVFENPLKATMFKPGIPINLRQPGLFLCVVEKKYKGYVQIYSCDGKKEFQEFAKLLESEYREDKIREIDGNTELSDHDKLEQMGTVLREPIEELGKELVELYDLI